MVYRSERDMIPNYFYFLRVSVDEEENVLGPAGWRGEAGSVEAVETLQMRALQSPAPVAKRPV